MTSDFLTPPNPRITTVDEAMAGVTFAGEEEEEWVYRGSVRWTTCHLPPDT